ncbi:hypothetical protein ACP275_08G018700 [Erythranthe tilingii]
MGRPPCCDKSNVKRGPWTPEEDAKILAYVASHGIGNWTLVPQKAGLNRCGKSCRLRWTNYLRPDLKHDNFTPEEEECILELHKTVGSRWSLIAKRLPGRTDNDVKNYWNTKLKKKLAKMGIDPVTHKPFSQVFSEYGKISCFPINANNNRNPFLKTENSNSSTGYDIMQRQPYFTSSSSNGVMRFGLGQSHTCGPSQAQSVPASPFELSNECVLGDYLSSSNYEAAQVQEEGHIRKTIVENSGNYSCHGNYSGASSSSSFAADSSFVEAILAHDSEMRLQFPDILDDDYGY